MGGRAPTPMPCTCPQLTNKIVFVVSFVGNRGTFIRGYKAMVMDMEFLYHVGYILTSVLGLFAHELFYSILVRPWWGWGWAGRRGGWGFLPVAGNSPAPGLLLAIPQHQACCCWAGRRGFAVSSSAGPSLAFKILMAPHGPISPAQWRFKLEPDYRGLHPSVAPPSCVTLGRFLICPCLSFPICIMDH